MTSSDPLTLSSDVRFCSTAFRRSSLLAIALLLSAIVAPVSFAQGPDSAGSYSIKWYAADPEAGTGPFLPTYIKLPPGSLSCPAPSGGLGRASAPLANAQAYAAPAIPSNRDAVTSLNPKDMALCQVVPYFVEISVTGSTAPENGVITVKPDWLTKTTSGGNFGFDPTYGLYCAFVDTADPFHVDPGSNAKVDSYGYTITGAGGSNETIAGTIQVSGLDNGDKVIVETWVVLKCTVPAGTSGNVQTSLSSAHTGPSNTSGDNISLGNQTVPLLQVGSFFTVDADVGLTKTASPSVCSGQNITYTVTVTNNSETTVANSIVVTDTLGTGLSFVSSTPAPTSQSGQVLTYNVGALSPTTSTVITIVATVTAASGTVTNSVTKTQITSDPVAANNSASVTTTVNELPGCTISGVSSVCPSSSGHVFSAPAGASSYSWSVTGDGSIVGPTNGQTVTISSTSTCNGSFTVSVTATTAAACNSTCSKGVTVIDSTPPSIGCPGPVGVQCFSQVPPADIGSVTASDNCGGLVTITHVGDSASSGTSSCNNVVTRTYRATDACGNTATCTQIITVHDTGLPVITLAAAGALKCNPTAAEIEAAFGAASVSDNCSQNLVAQGVVGQESGAGCSFQITKNWTVTDGCGNVGVQSQTVTYSRDTELPVITLAAAGALTCNPTAAEIEAAFGVASVSDNCSQNLIAQGTVIAEEGGAGCSFHTTKNWTVTDGCGNVGVQSQTVTYSRDTELPVITLAAAAAAVPCNPTAAQIEAAFGAASVSDNCSQNLIAQGTIIAEEGGAGCSFQTTKNWTVTDGCGNVGVQSQTVTYSRDTELPVITLAAAGALKCNPTAAEIEEAFGAASVSDNCSQNLIAQGVVGQESGQGCSFQITKNWTVTDGCGNVGVQSQTVSYTRDTELPVITLALAGALKCNPTAAEIEEAFGAASVSDNCSQNLIAQGVVGQESGQGCSFQITKNWTVTDGCGNVGVQSQTVSYSRDTELPVITLAAAGALKCNPTAAEIEEAFGAASVSDNCSQNLIAQGVVGQESGAGCSFQITKNWTVTDGCGNVGVQSQTVSYSRDTELPVITLAAAGALTCNPTAAEIEAAFGVASVSDNCSQNLVAQGVVGQESGAGCSFQITKNWTVTDGCGNVGVQSQTVSYTRDTELPVITLAAAGALTCNPTAAQIEAAFGLASVSDNCSQKLIAQGVVGQESGAGCSFQITKNWSVTDGCGNVGVQSQTVSYTRDTELPVITLAAAGTLPCNPTAAEIEAAFGAASVSDNCSQNLIAQGVVGQESGAGWAFQTTKNWTVTDGCGNVGVQSQTVSYTRDTELPVITLAAAGALTCNPTAAEIEAAFGAASVSDNCSQNLIAQGVVGQESGAGCSFQTTKNWTVTDNCGNVGVQSQTVTYTRDTELPVITLATAGTLTCNPTAAEIEAAFGAASVSDNCSQKLIAQGVVGQESGQGCSFQTTKNWTVTDNCGNVGVQSQTVSYSRDTELPVITLAAAGALTCNPTAAEIEAAFGAASVSDNCSQNLIAQGVVGQEGGQGCSFQTTKNWTVTDGCGNVGVQSQTVSYTRDTTAPVFDPLPAPSTIQCGNAPVFAPAFATDACDASVTLTSSDSSVPSGICTVVWTRTWTATDDCGNSQTATQTISVTDSAPPTLVCAGPGIVECPAPPVFTEPEVTDACDANPVLTFTTGEPVPGTCPQSYSVTRTWTATDVCGNGASCSQTITIVDTTPPVITCPAPFTVPCGTSTDPAITGTATSVDACDPMPSLTHSDAQVGSCPQGGQILRTWTSTDHCNNSSSCVQIITLTMNPGANCEPGFVADLGGECGAPAPYLTSSPPVIGKYLDVRVIGGTPNSPLVIAAQGPTFPPATPLGGPCVLWVDPNVSLLINDVTDANGEYQILGLLTDPGLLNAEFRVQGAVFTNGGPLGVVQLMNGILLHFGSCPPFCTAVRESYGGTGYAGQVFDLNYQAVFPNGLEIGQFDLPSGNLSPNGLKWDPTATGQAALKTFLGGAAGASSQLSSDLINPTAPPGGGQLALQTAALAINVGFNNANVMGSLTPGFANQIYWNFPGVPDSLNGLNITQILAVANTALAGLGLPPGYTMTTLTQHISELNLGYDGCNSTRWASLFLHHPVQ